MIPRRHYGSFSLVVAATGFIAAEAARRQGWIDGAVAELTVAGFEAATIGAVADWFAVTALFRRVPIPLLGRHTDIIARNRARITENIVMVVERDWLTAPVVGRALAGVARVEPALRWLEDPAHRAQADGVVRHLLGFAARALDSDEAAHALSRVAADELAQADLAPLIGGWLAQAVAKGEHGPAWEGLLRALADEAASPDGIALARRVARDAAARILPAALRRAAEGAGADAVAAALKRLVASGDLARPLGAWLADAAARGGVAPLATALLERLRGDLIGSTEFRAVIVEVVDDALERWKGRGWRQRLLGGGAELVGALRAESIANDVAAALDSALGDAQRDAAHPLRRRIDAVLAGLGTRLAAGDAALAEPLARLGERLVAEADLRALAARVIGWLEQELLAENGLVDWDGVARAMAEAARTAAEDAATHPAHPLRERVDQELAGFAGRLAAGDAGAARIVRELQARLLARVDLGQAMRPSLTRLRASLQTQLGEPGSPIERLAGKLIDTAIADLGADAARRERVERWLRDAVSALVVEHHDMIGEMIRSSLDPGTLSDRALVSQIEDKVGDDLQLIRVNGAVVGGLVGIALAGGRLLAP